MKNKMIKGIALMIASNIFGHIETMYFINRDGWHYYPETIEEGICDLVALVIYLFGTYLYFKGLLKFLNK